MEDEVAGQRSLLLDLKIKVAHERFELSSPGPKPDMLDHYTNGLHSHTRMCGFIYC